MEGGNRYSLEIAKDETEKKRIITNAQITKLAIRFILTPESSFNSTNEPIVNHLFPIYKKTPKLNCYKLTYNFSQTKPRIMNP